MILFDVPKYVDASVSSSSFFAFDLTGLHQQRLHKTYVAFFGVAVICTFAFFGLDVSGSNDRILVAVLLVGIYG